MTNHTLEYYNNNSENLCKRYESADVKELWSELINTFDTQHKLLEIGCGSGRDAAHMTKNGYDITAIDGSNQLINEALKTHPELTDKIRHIILPTRLPFDNESFDGVYSIACLMHFKVAQIQDILTEIVRVIRTNATVFISVPITRTDVFNDKDDNNRTFTLLNIQEWQELFAGCSLQTINTKIKPDGLAREGIEWSSFILKTKL